MELWVWICETVHSVWIVIDGRERNGDNGDTVRYGDM